MYKSRKAFPAVAAVGLALAVSLAQAAPVSFGVSAATISPGAGYGVDQGPNPENGGTLLDVLFGITFSAQSFALEAVGSSHAFDLGTVNFREPNTGNGGNLGIRGGETDFLDVAASLTLDLPSAVVIALSGTGTATPGRIDDVGVDYELVWEPTEVAFGSGGKFGITLNTLSFSNNDGGAQPLTATFTLLAAPSGGTGGPPDAAVPEPATLALVAVALAGVGAARRRRAT